MKNVVIAVLSISLIIVGYMYISKDSSVIKEPDAPVHGKKISTPPQVHNIVHPQVKPSKEEVLLEKQMPINKEGTSKVLSNDSKEVEEISKPSYKAANKKWDNEEVSYDWAYQKEESIRKFSNEYYSKGLSVNNLICKASTCRFEMVSSDLKSSSVTSFYTSLMMDDRFSGVTIYKKPLDESGVSTEFLLHYDER